MGLTCIMHQHALDPVLQRHRARIAGPARPPELQEHLPVLEAAEIDIPAVLLDRGADPRLEELLDHADNLAVFLAVAERIG